MIEIPGYSDLVEVGRGGFGRVYRARQASLSRIVAIKTVDGLGTGGAEADRFRRECLSLGAVSEHPAIAAVYDSGVVDGSGYLVMEYLDGGTLEDRISAGPVAWEQVAEMGVALAGALETAHRAGVLHRDLSPRNVMFDRAGSVRLVDFGLATYPGLQSSRSDGTALTLGHSAPEVIAGATPTVASDVYALGSVLFTAIAGHAPFARPGEASLVPLLARIAADPLPDLRQYGAPAGVAEVVERATAKDPAARFTSAEAFGAALAGATTAAGGLPLVPVVLDPMAHEAAPLVAAAVGEATAPSAPAASAASTARRITRRSAAIAVVGVLTLLLVAGAFVRPLLTSAGDPSALPSPTASGQSTDRGTPEPGDSGTPEETPTSSSPTPSGTEPSSSPTTSGSGPSTAPPSSSPTPTRTPSGSPSARATTARVGGGTTSMADVTAFQAGRPEQVLVQLRWSASNTIAGTRYEVRRRVMSQPAWVATADDRPNLPECAGAGGGVTNSPECKLEWTYEVGSSRSLETLVPALHLDGNRYTGQRYSWAVRARDSRGTSPWVELDAKVTSKIGVDGQVAVQMARSSGLVADCGWGCGDGPAPSTAQQGLIYRQSPTSGTLSPGSAVRFAYYGYTT